MRAAVSQTIHFQANDAGCKMNGYERRARSSQAVLSGKMSGAKDIPRPAFPQVRSLN
jgi:hypothetical protein